MAATVTHKFISGAIEGSDNTQVRPSNWNDTHTVTGIVDLGDSRLTDSRIASDVSAWAKAGSKPTYTPAEVGADASGAATSGDTAHLSAFTHSNISHSNRTALDAVSGVNTGDQTPATITGFGAAALAAAPAETATSIKAALGIATLSGANTGDQALPTTLPASDVSAWAKAGVKPTYTATEVGADAAGDATAAVTAHTSDIDHNPIIHSNRSSLDLITGSGATPLWNGSAWPGGGGSSSWLDWSSGVISITGTATATIGKVHTCSGYTADYTVTLPTAAGNLGSQIGFKMPSTNKIITLAASGAELINGVATRPMWVGESCMLQSDGVGWLKVAGTTLPAMGKFTRLEMGFANNVYTRFPVASSYNARPISIFNSGLGQIVAPRTGLYHISFVTETNSNNASATLWQNMIYVNGSFVATQNSYLLATKTSTSAVYVVAYVTGGGYIEAYANFTTGSYAGTTTQSSGTVILVTEIPTW